MEVDMFKAGLKCGKVEVFKLFSLRLLLLT